MKQEHLAEHLAPADELKPMVTCSERAPTPRGQRDEESLLVELAWLIIDGARGFQRLRWIPTRV